MDADQFERLLTAIGRNTDAQIEVAKGIHRLADECVTLATLLVDPEEAVDPDSPGTDMAGRPIKVS